MTEPEELIHNMKFVRRELARNSKLTIQDLIYAVIIDALICLLELMARNQAAEEDDGK